MIHETSLKKVSGTILFIALVFALGSGKYHCFDIDTISFLAVTAWLMITMEDFLSVVAYIISKCRKSVSGVASEGNSGHTPRRNFIKGDKK